MKICFCKEICATWVICWYRLGYKGRQTVWDFFFLNLFENLVSIKHSLKYLYFKVIPFTYTGKNKVYNSDRCWTDTRKICGRHIWPNLAGQISPCSIENPRGRRFWIFSDQIFCNDFITKFLNIKLRCFALECHHQSTNQTGIILDFFHGKEHERLLNFDIGIKNINSVFRPATFKNFLQHFCTNWN